MAAKSRQEHACKKTPENMELFRKACPFRLQSKKIQNIIESVPIHPLAVQDARQRYIFLHGQLRHQIIKLIYNTCPIPPKCRPAIFTHFIQILMIHRHRPRGWPVKTAQNMQHGGFFTPRRTRHCDKLAPVCTILHPISGINKHRRHIFIQIH